MSTTRRRSSAGGCTNSSSSSSPAGGQHAAADGDAAPGEEECWCTGGNKNNKKNTSTGGGGAAGSSAGSSTTATTAKKAKNATNNKKSVIRTGSATTRRSSGFYDLVGKNSNNKDESHDDVLDYSRRVTTAVLSEDASNTKEEDANHRTTRRSSRNISQAHPAVVVAVGRSKNDKNDSTTTSSSTTTTSSSTSTSTTSVTPSNGDAGSLVGGLFPNSSQQQLLMHKAAAPLATSLYSSRGGATVGGSAAPPSYVLTTPANSGVQHHQADPSSSSTITELLGFYQAHHAPTDSSMANVGIGLTDNTGLLYDLYQRRQLLTLAKGGQQQQEQEQQQHQHHLAGGIDLLRFRQQEQQYTLASIRNDMNRFSAPRFVDVATLRRLQHNAILEASASPEETGNTATTKGKRDAEKDTNSQIQKEKKGNTKGTITDALLSATTSSRTKETRSSSEAKTTSSISKRKYATEKVSLHHHHSPGILAHTAALSAPAEVEFVSKRAKIDSDPVYKKAWDNLMSDACKSWSSNGALFTMVGHPPLTSLSAEQNAGGVDGIPLGGTFVRGIVNNDPAVVQLLFSKIDLLDRRKELKKKILQFLHKAKVTKIKSTPPPANNLSSSPERSKEKSNTNLYEIGIKALDKVDEKHKVLPSPKQKFASPEEHQSLLVQCLEKDMNNFIQELTSERENFLTATVRKSVQLAYVETVNRNNAIEELSEATAELSKSNFLQQATRKQATSNDDRELELSAKIEQLESEHESKIARMKSEHENFVLEVLELHEKEIENLQSDIKTQHESHSQMIKNYLRASSYALKAARDQLASDCLT